MNGKILVGQTNIKQRFNSQLAEALGDFLIGKFR